MPKQFPEVSVNQLRPFVDPDSLPCENTASLEPLEKGVVGQNRGVDAIQFGIGLKGDGYNIFIAGPPKAGLTYIAKTFLKERARQQPVPPDWCYVYNFKEPDKPNCLKLRAGLGKELKKDMEDLIKTLQAKISEVFDSDDYHAREKELNQAFQKIKAEIEAELAPVAKEKGFVIQFSQLGIVLIPLNKEGQPMSQEDLNKLGDEEKKDLRERSEEIQDKMKEAIKRIREAESEFKEKHKKLDNQIALFVVEHLMERCLEKYQDEPDVMKFVKDTQEDILKNIDDFKKIQEESQQAGSFHAPPKGGTFRKYEVNLLIDNSKTEGAPVVIESNPAYPNLFGTIEKQAWLGALFTDFTMIKPGALHKANGGYLVMKALDLLKWYLSYEALKLALGQKEIKIEDPAELFGLLSTRTIRPKPIPLDVKIVLTGSPHIYELLYIFDERFQKFFKVKAHLDDRMDREETAINQFVRMMSRFCSEQNIRHVDRTGIARFLEYSMERTEDRDKLSLELGDICDLLKEADYFAGLENAPFIRKKHVDDAIEKRIYRASLVEERVKDLVKKDILWVETTGSKVGQVNGLSVLMTGDHEFGKPNRITATVSVGRKGVVAIERESELSGKIHTKGVMILSSFLRERFAHNKPISVTASLCFEQSYGMVEGDSASSTELYAILSALSGFPIRQGIAVTGSVSQKGEIQPVGGVTRKIEGFFDICKHKGLTGDQGVLIPEKNIRNLMLKQEVVDAVRSGHFHIWPIFSIEEGVEILTGVEAGRLQADGTYPSGTVFRKADERLQEIAKIVKEFGKTEEETGKR
ncbi:MAG TPA: AAA family ATPase [Desulfobacterales bacterium]|nr:AAA family ATPase [Desulfobacterales bacterium]